MFVVQYESVFICRLESPRSRVLFTTHPVKSAVSPVPGTPQSDQLVPQDHTALLLPSHVFIAALLDTEGKSRLKINVINEAYCFMDFIWLREFGW